MRGAPSIPRGALPPAPPAEPSGSPPLALGFRRSIWTRRNFLGTTGGLVLGFALPIRRRPCLADAAGPAEPAQVTAFLRIASDDTITVIANHTEMGQGIWTTIPML